MNGKWNDIACDREDQDKHGEVTNDPRELDLGWREVGVAGACRVWPNASRVLDELKTQERKTRKETAAEKNEGLITKSQIRC